MNWCYNQLNCSFSFFPHVLLCQQVLNTKLLKPTLNNSRSITNNKSIGHSSQRLPSSSNIQRSYQRRLRTTIPVHVVSATRSAVDTSSATTSATSYQYTDLGDANHRCRSCGASFWFAERLTNSPQNRLPEYHLCCGGGRIHMPPSAETPEYIQQLFQNKHFMENVRAYNQMFAMTSFGANIDESINVGRGPYVFKVSGNIYHWIDSLCPLPGNAPRFLQLYIYDTDYEIDNRLRHFGGLSDTTLDPEIVDDLIKFLDAHNELVQLF